MYQPSRIVSPGGLGAIAPSPDCHSGLVCVVPAEEVREIPMDSGDPGAMSRRVRWLHEESPDTLLDDDLLGLAVFLRSAFWIEIANPRVDQVSELLIDVIAIVDERLGVHIEEERKPGIGHIGLI